MVVETLKKSEIFSDLSDKEMQDISSLFEERVYRKDEYIFM